MVEQSYLMRSFTHEVIEQTCAQAARWWSEGITLPVAINLSARELLDPTLPESIESGLRRYRLQPKALRLEISERALVSDAEAIIPAIMSLAELGVTVALDDFGTGYFTLARLNGLPVGEVKVDGSFVRHVIDDSDSKVVVEAAVDLMNTLGLRAIAEGWRMRSRSKRSAPSAAMRPRAGTSPRRWMRVRSPDGCWSMVTWRSRRRRAAPGHPGRTAE